MRQTIRLQIFAVFADYWFFHLRTCLLPEQGTFRQPIRRAPHLHFFRVRVRFVERTTRPHTMSHAEPTGAANGATPARLDAHHLEQALEVLRDVSYAVDEGRTWSAIHNALVAPPAAALTERLANMERDIIRVMSIVANPAPAPAYLGNGLIFLPTAHGLPLIGFSDDLQLTPSLLQHRTWDPPTTRLLERIIRPGDRVLDIGANIGYFTVYAAALAGGTGHVHAFEPNPRTYDVLTRNVRLNNFGHVITLHDTALGAESGTATIHTFIRNQGGSTLSSLPDRLLDEWHERPVDHTVPVRTLDDVFATSTETFACIKMDAEGSEAAIWNGGGRFFRERTDARTVIVLEWNPPALAGANADLAQLLDTFFDHGFRVWQRDDALKVTPITALSQLDPWCNTELVLARDPGRIAEVCP